MEMNTEVFFKVSTIDCMVHCTYNKSSVLFWDRMIQILPALHFKRVSDFWNKKPCFLCTYIMKFRENILQNREENKWHSYHRKQNWAKHWTSQLLIIYQLNRAGIDKVNRIKAFKKTYLHSSERITYEYEKTNSVE